MHVHIQKLAGDLQQFIESARRYDPPDSSVRSYQRHARQVLDSAQSEYEIWSNSSEISSHHQNQDTRRTVLNWQDAIHDDVFSTIGKARPAGRRNSFLLDAEDSGVGRSLSSVSTTGNTAQRDTFRQSSRVDALVVSRFT